MDLKMYELDVTSYDFEDQTVPVAKVLAGLVTHTRLNLSMPGVLERYALVQKFQQAERDGTGTVLLTEQEMQWIRDAGQVPIGWDTMLLELALRIKNVKDIPVELRPVESTKE